MDELRLHRRSWLYWNECRCGFRMPCGQRQLLVEELVRRQANAAVDWYPRYFARRAHAERRAVDGDT